MDSKPSPLRVLMRSGATLFTALIAVLFMAGTALAGVSTSTAPPQNVTSSAATLEGQGTCLSGQTCSVYFQYKSLTAGSWQTTALVKLACTSSSTCSWKTSAPVGGLSTATGYEYQLCRVLKYTYCFGPDGTTRTVQQFVTAQATTAAPTNVTAPTIAGTAQQGNTLTDSPGSWTPSPTSYAYQWQDCSSSGGSCANIAGATAQTYTLGASDVGHTLVVRETASDSAGSTVASTSPTAVVQASTTSAAGDGTVGTSQFVENFANPIAASGYPPQAKNWPASKAGCNPFGSGQKCAGDWLAGPSAAALPPLAGVSNYADLVLYPSTQCNCTVEYVSHGTTQYPTNEVGTTTYESMAFYVPSSCTWPERTEIEELHFTNLFNGGPIHYMISCDHVTVEMDTGVCVQGAYCAYHSDADNPTGTPRGSTTLPGLYSIPPGHIVPGAWNEIVSRVDWETSNTGSVTSWYRAYSPTLGHTAWQMAGAVCSPSSSGPCGEITGIPTPQWSAGGTPPAVWNQALNYSFAPTSTLSVNLAGFSDTSGFASAANNLP